MDEIEGLSRAVDQQRGYADFFDWSDKRQKEQGILTMFVEALRRVSEDVSGEHLMERDPPDAVALSRAGAKIGIELVELVDQSLIERQKRDPESAHWRAWSREELREALHTRVTRKDRAQPELVHDLSEYWAVVHTDEPALTPEMVTHYLAGFRIGPCKLVTRCFLLMSYWPNSEGYPLIEVPVYREV
jgi:hypothetical protein